MRKICPICHVDDSESIVPTSWDALYLHCNACGHAWEVRTASQGQDEPYYEDESYFYFSPFSLWLSADVAGQRVDALQRYLKTGTVLEIGPGSGQVILAAERAGFTMSAAENSNVFVRHLRSRTRARIYEGVFDQIDFQAERFDGVLSFHVIEHLRDPVDHLRRVLEVAKVGGYLFLATPNVGSWDRRVSRERWTGYSIGHVNLFSSQSLRRSLERSGWDVITISTVEFAWQLLWSIKATIKPSKSAPQSAGSNVKRMPLRVGSIAVTSFGALTRPLRWIQERFEGGNELFVVARKA